MFITDRRPYIFIFSVHPAGFPDRNCSSRIAALNPVAQNLIPRKLPFFIRSATCRFPVFQYTRKKVHCGSQRCPAGTTAYPSKAGSLQIAMLFRRCHSAIPGESLHLPEEASGNPATCSRLPKMHPPTPSTLRSPDKNLHRPGIPSGNPAAKLSPEKFLHRPKVTPGNPATKHSPDNGTILFRIVFYFTIFDL